MGPRRRGARAVARPRGGQQRLSSNRMLDLDRLIQMHVAVCLVTKAMQVATLRPRGLRRILP